MGWDSQAKHIMWYGLSVYESILSFVIFDYTRPFDLVRFKVISDYKCIYCVYIYMIMYTISIYH